jgi:hypothetical protein
MAIRSRITKKPPRNNTGLKVLALLVVTGHERTFCQRVICMHINSLWGLNAYDPKIADADIADRSLNIMTADGVIHLFDISDLYHD